MRKIPVVVLVEILSLTANGQQHRLGAGASDRVYWADLLYEISVPVLSSMSDGRLGDKALKP